MWPRCFTKKRAAWAQSKGSSDKKAPPPLKPPPCREAPRGPLNKRRAPNSAEQNRIQKLPGAGQFSKQMPVWLMEGFKATSGHAECSWIQCAATGELTKVNQLQMHSPRKGPEKPLKDSPYLWANFSRVRGTPRYLCVVHQESLPAPSNVVWWFNMPTTRWVVYFLALLKIWVPL